MTGSAASADSERVFDASTPRRVVSAIGVAVVLAFIAAQPALAAPGDPDPSFGTGGFARLEPPDSDSSVDPLQAEVGPDGRVVIEFNLGGKTWLARHNPDGTADATFGGDGLVEVSSSTTFAVQADRKLVLIVDGERGPVVQRLNEDGAVDAGFGAGGTAELTGGNEAHSVVLQPDGKVVVSGATYSTRVGDPNPLRPHVERLNPDGTPDTGFGTNGVARRDDLQGRPEALALQSDGRILVGTYGGDGEFIARFSPDGTPDGTFGSGGAIQRSASEIVAQPDGKFLALGYNDGVTVTRHLSDGSLDTAFGLEGVARPIRPTPARQDGQRVYDSVEPVEGGLGLDALGRIIVAGYGVHSPGTKSYGAARLLSQGCLDGSYGGGDGIVVGSATSRFRPGVFLDFRDGLGGAAISPDGTVAVAGLMAVGEAKYTVVRLEGGGSGGCAPPPDLTPPTTAGPPIASLIAGASLGIVPYEPDFRSVPVRVSWPAGTDNRTPPGALTYDAEEWDGYEYDPEDEHDGFFLRRTSVRTADTVVFVGPAKRYHQALNYRVRARDGWDNTSAWAVGAGHITRYRESSRDIRYSGRWRRAGEFLRTTQESGARATLRFRGRNLAVVMPRRRGRGSAKICVDRRYCRTVKLGGARTPRRIVYTLDGLSTARHKVSVARKKGRIDLDGFVVLD